MKLKTSSVTQKTSSCYGEEVLKLTNTIRKNLYLFRSSKLYLYLVAFRIYL